MPHTKQQLRELLAAADTAPRHAWGQNFLIDLNLMRLLVQAADLQGGEVVLEVGCGTGSLTSLIAPAAARVIAVDIDARLADIARQELADLANVTVITADVLDTKNRIADQVVETLEQARRDHPGPFYLIANLPYQVASPLIVNLLLGAQRPDGMFITVQAEVAERMVARPGCKAYGLLSILMQAVGDTRLLRTINPQAFWPAPKVDSAIVTWRLNPDLTPRLADIRRLKQIIDLLLRHRRKKIKTCLGNNSEWLELLDRAGIDPHARGETLPVETFVTLANLWTAASDTVAG